MLVQKRKIGLYPGCFDPVHKQHVQILNQTLDEFSFLTEVWILINDFSEEKKIIAPFASRFKMLKQVISSDSRLKIYPTPIPFYTTDLVKKLKQKYPLYSFYLILGSDQINHLNKWEKATNLKDLVHLICAPRLNNLPNRQIINQFDVSMMQGLKVNNFNSSMIKKGYNWKFLHQATIQTIIKERLYFSHILNTQINDDDRFQHCHRVWILAQQLNERFALGCDVSELYIAALLHDLTKRWSCQEHLLFLKKHKIDSKELKIFPVPTWHAYTSAQFVEKELKITHPGILMAIQYHSCAHQNFDALGKVVFIADKLEVEKNDPFFDQAKKLLTKTDCNFDVLFAKTLEALVNKLKSEKKKLTTFTQEAYKQYCL